MERGFSINREVEETNLLERSIISQRQVCDYVTSVGGLPHVDVSNAMLASAASARQAYCAHLEEERRRKKAAEGSLKRKAIHDEIEGMQKKKKQLAQEISALTSSADKFAERAETAGDLTWVTKSNSLRRTAREKKKELENLQKLLDQKVETLKE